MGQHKALAVYQHGVPGSALPQKLIEQPHGLFKGGSIECHSGLDHSMVYFSMAKLPRHVYQYARETLAHLVSFPTVSAEDRAIPETAQAVAELLEGLGLKAEIHPTPKPRWSTPKVGRMALP